MSRSIHTTRKELGLERKYQLSNDEIKETRINKLQDKLDTKRTIKREKGHTRKVEKYNIKHLEPVHPEGLLINVMDEGQYIHYPVAKDDLVEVAKRLPVNAVAGIESITLCLGKEYQEEEFDGFGEKSYDPYTGRICSGDGPIYTSPILGVYRWSNSRIFLFAYVYDRQKLELDVVESFLRLKMLRTFIHEVAHHDDNMRRSGRGHCFGLNEDRCENYAEAQETLWAETIVIPYLLETYPDEYDRLLSWIKEMGGVDISLKRLIGEYSGRIGNLYRLGFTIDAAVDEMIRNATKGESNREIILGFAHDLHIGDHYDLCMEALETLLTRDPKDAEALGIKADTLIHLDKYDEAEIIAKKCLRTVPSNMDALQALCDTQIKRKNWIILKEISEKGIEIATDWRRRRFFEDNLIASLHLEDYKTAENDVQSLPDKNGRFEQKKLAFIALLKFVSGDVEDAVQIAKKVLAQEKVIAPAKAILKSIINKELDEIGDSKGELAFTEYEEDYLQMYGIRELIHHAE
jgi:tetratricopeptide (TPR) repeat protein